MRSFKTDGSEKWPLVVGIFQLCVNIEFVLTPLLIWSRGLRGFGLSTYTVPLATIELLYWYWFSGWLPKRLKKTKAARQIAEQTKKTNFKEGIKIHLWRIWEFIIAVYGEIVGDLVAAYNVANYADTRAFRALKTAGYSLRFILTLCFGFIPSCWVLCLGTIRATKWRAGLIPLIAGNALKIHSWGLFWAYLIDNEFLILVISLLVAVYFARKIYNRITRRKQLK